MFPLIPVPLHVPPAGDPKSSIGASLLQRGPYVPVEGAAGCGFTSIVVEEELLQPPLVIV